MNICCCSTKYTALRKKGKHYLGIRIMCPSGLPWLIKNRVCLSDWTYMICSCIDDITLLLSKRQLIAAQCFSEWLLFNTVTVHPYDDDNKLIFNEMMNRLLLIVESITLYCIVSVEYLECIQLYSLCMFSSVDGNILFNKIHDLLWWETSVVMDNKLIFNEMMMRTSLYYTSTLS
jgi:hypothetical protein